MISSWILNKMKKEYVALWVIFSEISIQAYDLNFLSISEIFRFIII